jgi:hypothetical protein
MTAEPTQLRRRKTGETLSLQESSDATARQRRLTRNRPGRCAFTLVEMLVSVALVLLIMSIFAQIYQIAGGALIRQKGMAENDQRSRMLTTILKGDLQQRTFRDVMAFRPGDRTDLLFLEDERRRGYFSVSENDPDDPTDDVLQLTIDNNDPISNPINPDQPPLFGAATLLRDPDDASGDTDPDYLWNHPDQAEFDDGQAEEAALGVLTAVINGTGTSTAAEVSYFLRNHNLYRRVLLIREPYSTLLKPTMPDAVYAVPDGNPAQTVAPLGTGEFWRDFDFSAYYEPGTTGLRSIFHDQGSLNNDSAAAGNANLQNLPESLGVPFLRFGNSINSGPGAQPREFIDMALETGFIGRFTMQETSNCRFDYPGRDGYSYDILDPCDGVGDPFDPNTVLALGTDGVVTEYGDESNRVSEDILLTDVHEFDIKVWDEAKTDNAFAPQFLDLGHGLGGDYGTADPLSTYGRRFDTWHPHADMNDGDPVDDDDPGLPPYRPVLTGALSPDGVPGVVGDDDGINGPEDPGEEGYLGSDDEIPLRAIQIRIRFFDPPSGRMRQLTIVQSLGD